MSRRTTRGPDPGDREPQSRLEDQDHVLRAAARYLEHRPRSIEETRRHLVTRGHALPLVEEALGRLASLGYLDDVAFARAWIESRDRAHPRGTAALRRELVLRGVPDEVIRSALEGRDGNAGLGRTPVRDAGPGATDATDAAAAGRLLDGRARRLLREADPRRRRAGAYALLARNGFDPGTCRDAVEAWLAGTGEGIDWPAEGD